MTSASLALLLVLVATGGCSRAPEHARQTAGDAESGQLLLRQYGCGSCHTIPGVAGARGNVGPPLAAIATRVYLGGVLPNTPENMARWIREPKKVDPRTAMPDMQVPEQHARDMVAYLYRQR